MANILPFLCLTACAALAAGEPLLKPMPGPGSGEAVEGLRATVAMLKPEYGPGESIMVMFKLANEGDKPVAIKLGKNHVYDFTFEARLNDIAINTARVEFTDYFSPEQKLQPGGVVTKLIDLRAIQMTDAHWAAARGKYEVRLCYLPKKLKTGWARFAITAPGERAPELDPELAEKIVALVAKLADPSVEVQKKACGDLVEIGLPALRPLEEAIGGALPDDVRERCKRIVEEIRKRHAPKPPAIRPPPPPRPPPEPPPDEF